MAFWRKMGDNLKNGTILGMLVALAMVWGNKVYSFLLINIPAMWIETVPLWAWLIIIGAIVGYIVDRH